MRQSSLTCTRCRQRPAWCRCRDWQRVADGVAGAVLASLAYTAAIIAYAVGWLS